MVERCCNQYQLVVDKSYRLRLYSMVQDMNETPKIGQSEMAQAQSTQFAMPYQILPPLPLDFRNSGEIAENWKLRNEKYTNYFVILRLQQESEQYQLAMFKHVIGDDGLKFIKTFSYATEENASDWRAVMNKLEKHCIGEVNEIY